MESSINYVIMCLIANQIFAFVSAMVIVAELVSVGKRTLARALVVVVSVGFGLVKPRLGPTLHKLLAVCFIYFILASVESCLRATRVCDSSFLSSMSVLPK